MTDKRNILVTGGAGFVGSHTCKALHRAGYCPIAYDSLISGNVDSVLWGPLEVGDIADRTRLDQVIEKYKPTAMIHFAAYAYVGESVTDPGKYYRNNVAGSLALLEAARDHGIDKFVFSSSCATYGISADLPISEASVQAPINPYGMSKLMVERILADFEVAYGLRSISLRYFNAAGADPDGEIGELHEPETHLLPITVEVALGVREILTVFGNDHDTRDGTCIRDYVHVSDLADAHVLALAHLGQGCRSTAFNLGNGMGFSVDEVISTVERITGAKVAVRYGPRRLGDPSCLIASADKARRELSWQPKFVGLEGIALTAVRWHQKKLKQSSVHPRYFGSANRNPTQY